MRRFGERFSLTVREVIATADPWLVFALCCAALFCVHGIGWGRVECWNPDQMALRDLSGLRPKSYLKPPFHTYLNCLLVVWPIRAAEGITTLVTGANQHFHEARVLGSRLVGLALFLGTIALGYSCSRRFYGVFAARTIALFFATSAGFVAYAHFLTVDSPLLFWMLATLFFAQRIVERGRLSDYVWAGLLTGICTATKYNGLVVGVTIPVAHLLAVGLRQVFDRRLILGLLAVPVGFFLGNPYSVFDHRKFVGDFMYNYIVTPAYEGQTGHGYDAFLWRLPEIIGWPGALLLAALAIGSLVRLALRWRIVPAAAWAGFCLSASVFVLYYAKIGAFARMPTRFVLPAAPFLILLAGPALQALKAKGRAAFAILALPILGYNLICSFLVGHRFNQDPRLAAQNWVSAHLPRGAVMESSPRCPHWFKLAGLQLFETSAQKPRWNRIRNGSSVDLRMPGGNGRAELFGRIFAGNHWVENRRMIEGGEPDESLFTRAALLKRNPRLVAIYSPDTQTPNEQLRGYYEQLLEEKIPPYRIVLDGETPAVSPFIYPAEIDFLAGRITILERADAL